MRIALDCEFSFDADNEFVCICACATQEDGKQFSFWRDEMDSLKEYIESHRADTWVAHNVETAEGYLFQSLGLDPTRFRWHDTLLMSRIVHNTCAMERAKHSLDACLAREKIVEIDHEKKKADQSICIWKMDCPWLQHLTQMDAHKEYLLKYCLSDTEHLLELDSKLDEKLVSRLTPGKFNHIDRDEVLDPSRRACYYGFLAAYASTVSWRGIPMDPERVERIKRTAPSAIARKQKEFLAKYPGTFRYKTEKGVRKLSMVTSKCREYAATEYGPKPPLTKTGEISLASDYTKSHKEVDDFLGNYYNMQKYCRALASFAKTDREKNWLGGYLPKRGVIRPRLNLLGTQTGRCGSKPSSGFVYTMGKAFRGLVNPQEGWVVVELDYHSEEIGIQAYLSRDKRMSKMYEGPDYYTAIAHSIDPSITSKKDTRRKKYKVISLMSNYGAGVAHLAEVSKLPTREATKVLNHLKSMFATYWGYVESCKLSCSRTRPLWFSDGYRIRYNNGKVTSLCNWPFQGCGAYILRKLLVELYKAKILLIAPVHDAVVFMCKESEWEATAAKVSELMRLVSKEALGTVVDVGEPEVTFHDYVNCHSELHAREDYEALYKEVERYDEKVANNEDVSDAEKYLHEYLSFISEVSEDADGDTSSLYLDEEWVQSEE